jgi:hypothetical protein
MATDSRGAPIADAWPQTDPRAVWLRSLGWALTAEGAWTGPVVSTRGGRYKPMTLEHAFDVAVKRCVLDHLFSVEVADQQARLTSPWRVVPLAEREPGRTSSRTR